MKRFEVYEMSINMVRAMRPVHHRIRQHDRDMAAQVKRAASSVPANIAEGALRQGADRLQHYRIAAGSASELRCHNGHGNPGRVPKPSRDGLREAKPRFAHASRRCRRLAATSTALPPTQFWACSTASSPSSGA